MMVNEAAAGDESAPVGPSAEEEAAFLSEERGSESFYAQAPKMEESESDANKAELPPLEDLVKRIPQPTRDLMEELFRARFVTVRRIPKAELKN